MSDDHGENMRRLQALRGVSQDTRPEISSSAQVVTRERQQQQETKKKKKCRGNRKIQRY